MKKKKNQKKCLKNKNFYSPSNIVITFKRKTKKKNI